MGGYGQRKEKGKCCNQRKKVENTSTFVFVFVIYVTGLGNRTGITGIAGNNTIIQLGGEYFPPLLGYTHNGTGACPQLPHQLRCRAVVLCHSTRAHLH